MSGLVLKTAAAAGLVMAVAALSGGGLSRFVEVHEAGPERLAAAVAPASPMSAPLPGGPFSVTLAANDRGDFLAQPSVNGVRIPMVVDTGASVIALSFEDASRAGIRPLPADFTARMSTANGIARGAPVTLREVSVGDIVVRDVRAVVMERGRLAGSLLGMSFLSKLSRLEIANDRLYLRR